MKRVPVRTATALAAAAVALAACTPPQAIDTRPVWLKGPTIEAQGRAFVELAPNRARFGLSYEHKAPTSQAASRQAVEKARVAAAVIREAAENAVRVTSDLSVRPYYQQITTQNCWAPDQCQEQVIENVYPDALVGYVATVRVNVEVLDPTKSDAVRAAGLAAGPTSADNLYFYLEPTADNQRAAFEAAAADAQARAKAAAASSGVSLGQLLILQEGQGPCRGYETTEVGLEAWDGAPAERMMAMAPPPPAPAPAPSFQGKVEAVALAASDFTLPADPEPQKVEARVCAIYAAG
jgi:hypothetical protein